MNRRPKLTYANVVATLALILAVGGGTVYAAGKLKKNSVKSAQIAKGAVKQSELGKNAVTTLKIKDGTVNAKDLVTGLIPAVRTDVTGSASVGVQPLLNPLEVTVPLNGTTTFTPQAGEVAAIAGEASFNSADAVAGSPTCFARARINISDAAGLVDALFLSTSSTSTTFATSVDRDAAGPIGLLSPGQPITLSATTEGDSACAPGTQVNSVQVRILQFK